MDNIGSDTLYPVSVYRDLALRGLPISQWHVPPASSAVPDLALMLPLLAVLSDPGYAFALYALLAGAVWTILVLAIGRFAHGDPGVVSGTVATLGLFWTAAAFSTDSEVPVLLWHPAYHGGAALAGLMIAVLVAAWMNKPRGSLLASATAVTLLVGASDPLLVPQGVLPAVVATWFVRQHLSGRHFWLAVGSLTTAAAVALLVPEVLERADLLVVGNAGWDARPRLRLHSVVMFIKDLPNLAAQLWPFLLLGTAWCVWTRRTWRESPRTVVPDAAGLKFLLVFGVVAVVASAATPVLGGAYLDTGLVRLMLPAWVYPVAQLPLVWRRAPRAVVVGSWGVAALLYLPAWRMIEAKDFRLPYPPAVQCIEAFVGQRGLSTGIGDYWSAKYVTELSRTGLRVNAYTEDLQPMIWIANPAWWMGPDGQPLAHHFVVSLEERPGENATPPLEVTEARVCGEFTVEVLARPVAGASPGVD